MTTPSDRAGVTPGTGAPGRTSSLPRVVAGVAVPMAAAAGLVLGAGLGLVAAAVRGRPLHPVGRTYHVTVRRTEEGTTSGVPWLDAPEERAGLVRFSRGAGLPGWAPDVQGLALRLPEPDGRTDVLLASTGLRGVARYLLAPRRSPLGGPVSTVMPFRGPRGPVVLAAEPLEPNAVSRTLRRSRRQEAWPPLTGTRWLLLRSGLTGPWEPFAMLDVGPEAGSAVDQQTRFDPLGSSPPGLPPYRWLAVLRDPAYRLARALGRRG